MLIRINKYLPTAITCLLAVLLVVLCASNVNAQTLQAQLATRAVTNDDITSYALPSTTESSGGLATVGLGQPVYLDAEVDIKCSCVANLKRDVVAGQQTGRFERGARHQSAGVQCATVSTLRCLDLSGGRPEAATPGRRWDLQSFRHYYDRRVGCRNSPGDDRRQYLHGHFGVLAVPQQRTGGNHLVDGK